MSTAGTLLVRRIAIVLTASLTLVACATTERVSGVPRGITFAVTPVYPNSYDVTASGSRNFSAEIMKDAWLQKAAQLAKGRKYKTSTLTVHDTEVASDNPYVPMMVEGRSVSGTINILSK
jgi:hypothetical protein